MTRLNFENCGRITFCHTTLFCWQLALYRHLPTSVRQNSVKKGPQPLIAQKAFVPLDLNRPFHVLWPIPISRFVYELEAE